MTLVANVFFAHFWLHESLSWREILGTACIVVGSTLSALFGDHTEITYTLGDLQHYWGGALFLIYALLITIVAAIMYKLCRRMSPVKQQMVDAYKRYELASAAHDADRLEWEDSLISTLEKQYAPYVKIHPFAICALSGICGGQSILCNTKEHNNNVEKLCTSVRCAHVVFCSLCVLCVVSVGKMVSELISTTASGPNQLFSPLPYVFIICMLICVFTQLHFLAMALNFFDALCNKHNNHTQDTQTRHR